MIQRDRGRGNEREDSARPIATHEDPLGPLVLRAQRGDDSVWPALSAALLPVVRAIAKKALPRGEREDMVQSTLVEVWRSIQSFEGKASFMTWVHVIAARKRTEFCKKQQQWERALTSVRKTLHEHGSSLTPERGIEEAELKTIVQQYMAKLRADDRKVLTLRYFHDDDYSAIARTLDCSEEAAKLKCFRARNRLKKRLKKGNGEERLKGFPKQGSERVGGDIPAQDACREPLSSCRKHPEFPRGASEGPDRHDCRQTSRTFPPLGHGIQSALALAVAILKGTRCTLPPYSCAKSRHDFTQPQLLAMLALRRFFHTDYRGLVQFLSESSDLRRVLGLQKVPHFTTLQKAEQRLAPRGPDQNE